jgi:hypothetical protein
MFLNLNSTASTFFCQELALNPEQCNLPKILENAGAFPGFAGQNHAGLRFCGRIQSVQTYSIVLLPKRTNSKTVAHVSIMGIILTPWGAWV